MIHTVHAVHAAFAADVARAVGFLVDPVNGFVTGQVLGVCGGTSVGSPVL